MNRQQLTYFRVVALIMAGLVALLTIGNLFTIATKGISVELPTEDDFHWSVDPLQKEILFRTSFCVQNHGVYDIKGIDVSARLVKDDQTTLYTFEKHNMAILRGGNTTIELLVPFDLDKIPYLDWFSLIYRNTTLKLFVDVDAQYMFGLIEFTASDQLEIPWAAPVGNLTSNKTVQAGIHGLFSLLSIAENKSLASLSDIVSLFSLPTVSYTADNGFAFSLNISSYSETMKNISCRVFVPLFVVEGGVEFTASILIGFEGNDPVFQIRGVGLQYVS